jgi:indolepyruvate ferredoxin oxidoreductase alpha subunit
VYNIVGLFKIFFHKGVKGLKKLLTGNEAIARGAFEAGVKVASAYPGTPSTEILENVAQYKEIYSQWSTNEKVAFEVAAGASMSGVRALAAMKHVGVNVAADPLFTFAYTGVTGGFVLVSADDPGMHSSQNEQDNRNYAKFAKLPMLEPSDSQEAKDYTMEALKISEEFDTPVMLRITTRIAHGKSLVELGERQEVPLKEYQKNPGKFVMVPANARVRHVDVEDRLKRLKEYSENFSGNEIFWGDKKVGIITSGICYQYAREVFGDFVSYLKLGMTFPVPMDKIKEFASSVEELYVIEELEPYLEEQIKAEGIKVVGKEIFPNIGEFSPELIKQKFYKEEIKPAEKIDIPNRPPVMCTGCPHRGFYYELKKYKVAVTGDIGCYTLGTAPPLNMLDTCLCMGASISNGLGFVKAWQQSGKDTRVVAVIGDSTFFHSGMTGLVDVVYHNVPLITVILDNRITGMTGHQDNPGTGRTLMGEETPAVDIEKIVRAIGVEKVFTIDPYDLKETKVAIKEVMAFNGPSVIITKKECALLKNLPKYNKYYIDQKICKKCKACSKLGCPAIEVKGDEVIINAVACFGCSVCAQVCPFKAILEVKGEE